MSKHKDVDTRSQCGGWVAPGRELFGTDHWCVYCGAKWSDKPAADIRTGSIASGTMRAVDRLPALLALADEIGAEIGDQDRTFVDALTDDEESVIAAATYAYGGSFSDDAYAFELASEITSDLIDAIDEALPEGFHVGNHPGDPADLGLWAHCTEPSCDGWDECEDEAHYPAGHFPY